MRRLIVLFLATATCAAAALAVGAFAGVPEPAVGHAGPHATPSPLAGLDRTFRALAADARCAEATDRMRAARRQRAAALKGARTARPRVLAAKKAVMRAAIKRARAAVRVCDAAAAAPPGGAVTNPAPGATSPAPPTTPGPAPVQTITLHVAAGSTFAYTETSASAAAGALRIVLENGSSLSHFVAVRPGAGQPAVAESPLAAPGGTTQVDVTLAAGTYQVFCRNNGHDQLGMVIPLTIT